MLAGNLALKEAQVEAKVRIWRISVQGEGGKQILTNFAGGAGRRKIRSFSIVRCAPETQTRVLKAQARLSPLAIVRGKPSFDTGDRLRAVIADHAPMEDLSDAVLPCHVGTTDASTGQVTWWTDGPLVELLCATTAVPGVLPAVDLGDGTLHIDGGVVSNIPLRRGLSLQPTRLVVLDVAAKFAPAEKQTALSLMMVGVRAAAAELTRQQWLDVPAEIDVLHVELPTEDDAPDFEFDLVPELLEQGADVARRALKASEGAVTGSGAETGSDPKA